MQTKSGRGTSRTSSAETLGAFRELALRKDEAAGLLALFAGPASARDAAAAALAEDLGRSLERIDLRRVLSRQIGETEKNLDRVLAAAESSNAVLLFDEAEALFGKRSEIENAHDKYANQEVSYLLDQLEGYSGIAILASNGQDNLDPAFIRRIRLVVEFPPKP
jgi:SpoVK/Ycf46/Vps4 family AAA+-type ATPase